MFLGNFARAWEESSLIEATGVPDPHRYWNGQPWAGKRIMLRGLHGLGDTIQFIRFAPLLREEAESVTLQVHPQLVTLLEGARGVDRVITWPDRKITGSCDWDIQMELTELPRVFRTTVNSLPSSVPYLEVPEERRSWARGYVGCSGQRRVGLVWKTGDWNRNRSIPLQEFNPLLKTTDCKFYSLQKDADLGVSPPGIIVDIEKHSADVRDTAALLLEMDLIITADTMTAHLAGALGRPVWILLPFDADWRWMLRRRDSPWYPTARLIRQQHPGDWSSAIKLAATWLSRYSDGLL
jgi:hypothetical protein